MDDCDCGLKKIINDRIIECRAEIDYLQNKDTLYIGPLERLKQEISSYEDLLLGHPRRDRIMSFVKRS